MILLDFLLIFDILFGYHTFCKQELTFGKEVVLLAEQAYCVKCRKKVDVQNGERVTMKNGRPALKGKCAECGTGVYKILSTK